MSIAMESDFGTFQPMALELTGSVEAHEVARAIGEVVVRHHPTPHAFPPPPCR